MGSLLLVHCLILLPLCMGFCVVYLLCDLFCNQLARERGWLICMDCILAVVCLSMFYVTSLRRDADAM